MLDIGSWLARLGLAKYADVFAQNEIDLDTLRHLSDDDLKELGLPIGPRRKVMAAVIALNTQVREPTRAIDTHTSAAGEAERRQLTVMFVDLVGSTALSAAPRPRGDARGPAAPTRTRSRARSRASRGTSPSSWATACWPTSAGRRRTRTRPSARCGLASRLRQAVGRLATPAGEPLAARVGIATGLVVVGDLVGEGRGAGGGGRRRDAEPCGTAAGAGRAGHGADRGWHAPAARRAVRAAPTRTAPRSRASRSPCAACGSSASAAAESRFEALRGPARRPGRPRARSWRCCSTAGGRPAPARARWCCCRASPASASRGWSGRAGERSSAEPHAALRYHCSPHHTAQRASTRWSSSSSAPPACAATTAAAQARQARGAAAPGCTERERGGAAARGAACRSTRAAATRRSS